MSFPAAPTTIEEVIDDAIAAHEKCVRYAALQLDNYRRIKAALEFLDQGKLDDVRRVLNLALNDNGDFAVKRIEKIAQRALGEHAEHNTR